MTAVGRRRRRMITATEIASRLMTARMAKATETASVADGPPIELNVLTWPPPDAAAVPPPPALQAIAVSGAQSANESVSKAAAPRARPAFTIG